MLKKTIGGEWGHPICLMMATNSIVESYEKLNFHYWKLQKNKKSEGKCEICSKSSLGLENCFNKDCQKKAHLYCILKSTRDHIDEDIPKWFQDLKIFPKNIFNFLKYTEEKFKKLVRNQSPLASRLLFGTIRPFNNHPMTITYCPEHDTELISCFCLKADTTEIDWVYCDSCGKWYHFSCEEIVSN